jgi:hypothetical protein
MVISRTGELYRSDLDPMIPVAASQGVTVSCPRDGLFSFYNSPYPAHRLSTGVDLYPTAGFGGIAPSPVSGEVTLIRRVRSPRGRGYEASEYDVVTLLRSRESPDKVVKLLHVDPTLSVGDEVRTGEGLGRLLRSGYYGFATSPHVHVEVREPSDPLRARGGHRVERTIDLGRVEPIDELRGTVTTCSSEFSIVSLETDARGLPADVGGVPCVLDGGIPYYGWMGVHFDSERPRGGAVELAGHPVATVREVRDRSCLADCTSFSVSVDGSTILGLSLRLSPKGGAEVKLVPRKIGGLVLEEGDEVTVDFEASQHR